MPFLRDLVLLLLSVRAALALGGWRQAVVIGALVALSSALPRAHPRGPGRRRQVGG